MRKFRKKKQEYMQQVFKDAVYDAVLDVLFKHGVEGLTIQKVASSADIATGTLYNYFKDKDALFAYVTERLLEEINLRVLKAKENNSTAKKQLKEMTKSLMDFAEKNTETFNFLDQARAFNKVQKDKRKSHIQKNVNMISEMISDGIKDGSFRNVDPDKTADFFHCAIIGIAHIKPDIEDFDPKKSTELLTDVFFNLIEKKQNYD